MNLQTDSLHKIKLGGIKVTIRVQGSKEKIKDTTVFCRDESGSAWYAVHGDWVGKKCSEFPHRFFAEVMTPYCFIRTADDQKQRHQKPS